MFPLIQLPRKSEAFDHQRGENHRCPRAVSINSTSEEVRSFVLSSRASDNLYHVSINSTSEEVRRMAITYRLQLKTQVSINSTSEEVRSERTKTNDGGFRKRFPLIQLPRKSEEELKLWKPQPKGSFGFPLIQLPRKSEEGPVHIYSSYREFPLIQLPRKSEGYVEARIRYYDSLFPLIQLPRKSEGLTRWPSLGLPPSSFH